MLKNRLIPSILCKNGNNVVQSINFKHTNIIGNAITAVDFYNNPQSKLKFLYPNQ